METQAQDQATWLQKSIDTGKAEEGTDAGDPVASRGGKLDAYAHVYKRCKFNQHTCRSANAGRFRVVSG
jgi:hypothetical protein